jgi:serine/threonine protein phosphatase 1
MTDKHVILDFSHKTRVFVAGDIHGEYQMLLDELAKQNFNESNDVLVLVGDLADRGPNSEAMIDFIDNPWVYRVLGNHDIAPRMYLDRQIDKVMANENFGGSWFTKLPREEIEQIAAKFEDAPVALTITTPGGRRIGVVHADCGRDWNHHVHQLHKVWVYDLSLWSRETIKRLMDMQAATKKDPPATFAEVANIDHVFHGHTPIAVPFTCGNRSWIDTGAVFGGTLTMWDVDAFLTSKGT